MSYIFEGVKQAVFLITSLDGEVIGIAMLSLFVSAAACLISAVIFMPVSIVASLQPFKGEGAFMRFISVLMSIPTVVIGLMVVLLLARRGPFGSLSLLYTPFAMIIAQGILVSPLIVGLSFQVGRTRGRELAELSHTLGASKKGQIALVFRELKGDFAVIISTAFARAISEVGAVMMVGGNIRGKTRVLTTAIAQSNSMGEYSNAIALGIILLIVSVLINILVHKGGE